MNTNDLLGITSDDISDAQDMFDAMLNTFGRSCRLFYPSLMVSCSCGVDPIGNKPGNIWSTGGRVGYPNTQNCGLCNNTGKIAQQNTEDITLVLYWNPSEYRKLLPVNFQVPNGTVMTRGFMSDFPKVEMCESAILGVELMPYKNYRYKRLSEPIDYALLVQGRYFLMLWQRT